MAVVDRQLLLALKEDNTYLKKQNQDLKEDVDRLRQVILALNKLQCNVEALDVDTDILGVISNLLTATLEAVNSRDGSLLLLDEETNELVFVAVLGESQGDLIGYRIPADAGIAGWVSTHRQPALVPDVREDPRWLPTVDQWIGFHTACLMAAPLEFGERVLGVLEVVYPQDEKPFAESDLDILVLASRLASFVLAYTEEITKNQD